MVHYSQPVDKLVDSLTSNVALTQCYLNPVHFRALSPTSSHVSTPSQPTAQLLSAFAPENELHELRAGRSLPLYASSSGRAAAIGGERFKFQLVCILWPALVGILMAM